MKKSKIATFLIYQKTEDQILYLLRHYDAEIMEGTTRSGLFRQLISKEYRRIKAQKNKDYKNRR